MLRGISPFFQQVEPKPHLVLCRGLWLAWLIVKREGEAGFTVMLDPSVKEVKVGAVQKRRGAASDPSRL